MTWRLVAAGGALDSAINLYRVNVGQYPTTLENLTTRPADPALAEKYGPEPFIDPNCIQDPWGHPFQYRIPGVHNPSSYDLWSMGSDGVNETADDIGNW